MKQFTIISILVSSIIVLAVSGRSDDTCIFYPAADEVLPSIVLYIDNSGDMEEVRWHDDFDNVTDWTPAGAAVEIIDNPGGGDGFLNEYGYGIYAKNAAGNSYSLAPFEPSSSNVMEMDSSRGVDGVDNGDGTFSWTFNGRVITLPVEGATGGFEELGLPVINFDPADEMRYSTNYLNWLFFGDYTGNGDDLKKENRFYFAKKAMASVLLDTENKAMFSIWYHTNDDGAVQKQPLKLALDETSPGVFELSSEFLNNINGLQTYDYSPLAEGLAEVAGYFDSANSHGENYDCAQQFIILISSGISSKDIGSDLNLTAAQYEPDSLADYDSDDSDIGEGWIVEDNSQNNKDDDGDGEIDEADERIVYEIPTGYEGSTYLDDIAYFIYNNDVGYADGYQNIVTYTIGFMGDHISNLFLLNTSNNGNGFTNLYDTNDPDYGKYHYEASSPEDLVTAMSDAISSILERTTVFAAPVVPVSRTTSGDRIYMSFFTPQSGNFWEGNVVKFGLNENNEIVDANGDLATEPNGALKESAVPIWSTINWAADAISSPYPEDNGIFYSQRPIYTYLGVDTNITAAGNEFNNINMTETLLGTPLYTVDEIVDYIRGADVFDDDADTITDENREVITGDVLHSEPAVHEYISTEGTLTLDSAISGLSSGELLIGNKGGRAYVNGVGFLEGGLEKLRYERLLSPFSVGETVTGSQSGTSSIIEATTDRTMIFFGANDGMLHAVKDENGLASWSFIPPNQLARLKDIVEGSGHNYFVDGSPKTYFIDDDGDGFIDTDGDDDNDGTADSAPDRVILVSGERKGSNSFFALDISDPDSPQYLWRISATNDSAFAPPTLYAGLGESWSEPRFGKVKTTDADTTGTDALIIGGGYSDDNSQGTSLYILNVLTGDLLREFTFIPAYSIASAVTILDTNDNGFIDKLYIGNLGGNMYRLGNFMAADNFTPLPFPNTDENINKWGSHLLFSVNDGVVFTNSKFFYPPSVTLERGYDLVFMATGDRENPCDPLTSDGVFVVKDTHSSLTSLTISDLLDITDPSDVGYTVPDLNGTDMGWYYQLSAGEKVLSKGLVFTGSYFFTTFTPNDDPCLPGGFARLYALNYKTGAASIDFDGDGTEDPGTIIGGGIPSSPVLVISDDTDDTKLLISVGSTNADDDSESQGAGIIDIDPEFTNNFFYIWWRDWLIP